MTEHVKFMLNTLRSREYRKLRDTDSWEIPGFWEENDYVRSTLFLKASLEQEIPVILERDVYGFNRHKAKRPTMDGKLYGERFSNIVPDFNLLISRGLNAVIDDLNTALKTAQGEEILFCTAAKEQLQSILAISSAYRDAAKAAGNTRLYDALCRVPAQKADSLYEACLFQKILTFSLRCANYKHLPMGRFDQYMYPYYLADVQRSVSREELLETLELYFISLNLDTDLYEGIQQGDNGQSIVLGGYDPEGNDQFNELSMLCMDASLELSLIDPKINLRGSKKTQADLYAIGTKMTKKGLGFPQYCNDDVVIPGLIKLGYRPEDAANYAVAACWEFIIPGYGADVPNVCTINLPLIVNQVMESRLETCKTFEELMAAIKDALYERFNYLQQHFYGPEHHYFGGKDPISPLISMMMHGCLEQKKDIGRQGTRYYNLGVFSIGISTAADSLAAVKMLVFEEKSVDAAELMQALRDNFEGHTALRNQLMSCPKMGNDDDFVDSIAAELMEILSHRINGAPNGTGGVWRVGTGSAQMYVSHGAACGATADGRKNGAYLSCSYSPALHARVNGPLSVICSFTKFDLTNMINGGPLTIEIHDNVFRNTQGEAKVAELVRLFILSGGHQLQLNAINREVLLDAMENPQDHQNLVVRVWGWSGYFCELDQSYQNHILERTAYTL